MWRYVLKRLLIAIPVFIGITCFVFFLSVSATGSPLDLLLNDPLIPPEEYAALAEKLGVNEPFYIQYFNWFGQLLRGNFGFSYRTSQPVLAMIGEQLGPTLLLTVTSTLLSVLIAIPLGVMSAYKPYTTWDYASSVFSFLGASIPNFFAGLLLIYFFSTQLKILPLGGMFSAGGDGVFGDRIVHLVMPVVTFCIQQVGSILRQTRSSMLEIMKEDFVRTARGKGLSEFDVVVKHGVRNALIPVVTVVVNMLPFVIGGAVITEQIFSWPGLGSLMVLSINSRDYPVIMGVTVLVGVVVLVGNIIADIIYGLLDPKIRMSR